MRYTWYPRLCAALLIALSVGCSQPLDEQHRARAEAISKDMDHVTRIEIIAPRDPAHTHPLSMQGDAKRAAVIATLELGRDEPDFTEIISGLKAMLRGPLSQPLELVTRIWLRLRIPGRDYAYYCMYEPEDSFLAFTYKGPVDMNAPGADKQWHGEVVWTRSDSRFRDIINRHIPAKWTLTRR